MRKFTLVLTAAAMLAAAAIPSVFGADADDAIPEATGSIAGAVVVDRSVSDKWCKPPKGVYYENVKWLGPDGKWYTSPAACADNDGNVAIYFVFVDTARTQVQLYGWLVN